MSAVSDTLRLMRKQAVTFEGATEPVDANLLARRAGNARYLGNAREQSAFESPNSGSGYSDAAAQDYAALRDRPDPNWRTNLNQRQVSDLDQTTGYIPTEYDRAQRGRAMGKSEVNGQKWDSGQAIPPPQTVSTRTNTVTRASQPAPKPVAPPVAPVAALKPAPVVAPPAQPPAAQPPAAQPPAAQPPAVGSPDGPAISTPPPGAWSNNFIPYRHPRAGIMARQYSDAARDARNAPPAPVAAPTPAPQLPYNAAQNNIMDAVTQPTAGLKPNGMMGGQLPSMPVSRQPAPRGPVMTPNRAAPAALPKPAPVVASKPAPVPGPVRPKRPPIFPGIGPKQPVPMGVTGTSAQLPPKTGQAAPAPVTPTDEEYSRRSNRIRKILGTILGASYGTIAGGMLGGEVLKRGPNFDRQQALKGMLAGMLTGGTLGYAGGTIANKIKKYVGAKEPHEVAPTIQIVMPPDARIVNQVQDAIKSGSAVARTVALFAGIKVADGALDAAGKGPFGKSQAIQKLGPVQLPKSPKPTVKPPTPSVIKMSSLSKIALGLQGTSPVMSSNAGRAAMNKLHGGSLPMPSAGNKGLTPGLGMKGTSPIGQIGGTQRNPMPAPKMPTSSAGGIKPMGTNMNGIGGQAKLPTPKAGGGMTGSLGMKR